MEKVKEKQKILHKFIKKFITLEIIIGIIAFLLEYLIPEIRSWDFSSKLIIYQSVIFIISTLLTTVLAAAMTIKNIEFENKEEARKTAKSIKKVLCVIAIIIMIVNILAYIGMRESKYKDIDVEYKIGNSEYIDSQEQEIIKEKKEAVKNISTIYILTKELIIILTYMYAGEYIEKMIELNIKKIANKNEENKDKKEE